MRPEYIGMEIKMTGSSGYLGQYITDVLMNQDIKVSGINREFLYGPTEELANRIKNTRAIINLAGAPILQRWTAKNQEVIYKSRVITARNLVQAIKKLSPGERPERVISASAVGIYAPNDIHSEKSKDLDSGFLGSVVKDWEAAWDNLPTDVGLTIFRIAVVLGRNSPTVKKMLLPFKLGIGGKIGNGKQPFPFVHEKDVANAFLWALEDTEDSGIYNLAAPQQITNNHFTKALASVMHRPAFLPIPVVGLKLLYGDAASLLTESPAVIPECLELKGFKFQFLTIEDALEEIFQ